MQDMQKTPSHKNKGIFVQKAEEMAEKLSVEATPCYDIMSSFHDLSELLAQSSYKMNQVEKFRNREDVKEIIGRVRGLVQEDDPEA